VGDSPNVIVNPYELAPLTALVFFHTDENCQITYTVKGKTPSSDWKFSFHAADSRQAIPVFGLYPGADNLVTFELQADTRKKFDIHIKTEELNVENAEDYPHIRDCNKDIRYLLLLPVSASTEDILPLANNRFLFKNNSMGTPTESKPLATHLYEADLFGRIYRTYYVGNGVASVDGETPEGNLVIETQNETGSRAFATVNRETGEILHLRSYIPEQTDRKKQPLTTEHLGRTMSENLVHEELHSIPFATTGWLREPVLYKGASIGTAAAVPYSYLEKTYQMRLCICGDTLLVHTKVHQIQEIVFSKSDRIYQLDLTSPVSDSPESIYTLAIPFTEMYSGTYSIVIRFRDGGQEVLADTITLSRTRNV
jgi:hypothetical protein